MAALVQPELFGGPDGPAFRRTAQITAVPLGALRPLRQSLRGNER